jgi:branched-chain amino acid transport system permease protein
MASIAVPPVRFLGVRIDGDLPTYYMALLVCAIITVFMLNVGRTAFGRALAAIRERDYAAEIIGIDTFKFKLLAFWTSSFIGGVVGSVLVVCYLRSVSPEQFDLDHSVEVLAMVIVGGLGSILGSFFGAALVLFAPIVFNNLIGYGADRLGLALNADLRAHLPLMLYGALIILFLVIEPLGLAKIYDNIRNYFLVWPFRTARR